MSESFQQAKDAGFKVVSHMMPDLPNVDFERDIQQFVVSPGLLDFSFSWKCYTMSVIDCIK